MSQSERLQKILAQAGLGSRRQCETYILAGRVSVNGRTVTQLGVKADPRHDTILFDGHPLVRETRIYLLLNKPAGYVTTLADPQGRPIVTDLVPDIGQRIFPVGRLDLDSEGALLMTNDGRLANYILHPRYGVHKTYRIVTRGRPTQRAIRRLERGILIDGKRTLPARIRFLGSVPEGTRFEVILHEGKKRQIRKMFAAIGHPVVRLQRIAYGGLGLGSLKPGQYRTLRMADLKKIFSGKIPFTIKNIPD